MTTQLKISNGTTTIDLLSATGFAVEYGKWAAGAPQPTVEEVVAAIGTGGGRVSNAVQGNVQENMDLVLQASSHDNAASQLQELEALLEQAFEYQEDPDQFDPVYLIHQTAFETNPRYSKVVWGTMKFRRNFHHMEFIHQNVVLGVQLMMRREPFWRNIPPGTLPDDHIEIDTLNKQTYERIFEGRSGLGETYMEVTQAAALEGDWGITFRAIGGVTGHYFKYGINMMHDEPEWVFEFMMDFDSYRNTSENGNNLHFIDGRTNKGGPASSFKILLGLDEFLNVWRLSIEPMQDSGSYTAAAVYDIPFSSPPGPTRWAIELQASSGPGMNDGFMRLREGGAGGTIRAQITGIDNDTITTDEIWMGLIAQSHPNNVGEIKLDTLRWGREAATSTVDWQQVMDFENFAYQVVGNHRHNNYITNIYNYDDSATAWSPNLANDSYWRWWEVNGSQPGILDMLYIGSILGPFYGLVFYMGAAPNDSIGILQYWNGAAWVDISESNYDFRYLSDGRYGLYLVNWDGEINWASTTVNGVAGYWVRWRENNAAFLKPAPCQVAQLVYTPNSEYIEIDSSDLSGKLDVMTLLRAVGGGKYGLSGGVFTGLLLGGMKSRGLTRFTSRINCGGQNNAGWSETYPTADSTKVASTQSAAGSMAEVTFTSTTVEAARFTAQVTDPDVYADFEGRYQVYLRCQQKGGVVGDVAMRMILSYGLSDVKGQAAQPLFVDTGPELIDLGSFSFRPLGVKAGEKTDSQTMKLTINAWATSATPDLEMYELILIPTDELFIGARRPYSDLHLFDSEGVQLDAGVLREPGAIKFAFNFGDPDHPAPEFYALNPWEMNGAPPLLPPNKTFRFYFLFGAIGGAGESGEFARLGQMAGIQIRTVNLFRSLRGSL